MGSHSVAQAGLKLLGSYRGSSVTWEFSVSIDREQGQEILDLGLHPFNRK
jgi:hypothetical protein